VTVSQLTHRSRWLTSRLVTISHQPPHILTAISRHSHNQIQSDIATDSQSVSQSVLVSSPIWGSWPDIYYCLTVTVLLLWGALGDVYYNRNKPEMFSMVSHNDSYSSLYNLSTDCAENTASRCSSIVASRGYRSDRVENTFLLIFTAITHQRPLFTESLLSNGSACYNIVSIIPLQ
jgi:hypothetical protein